MIHFYVNKVTLQLHLKYKSYLIDMTLFKFTEQLYCRLPI